MERLNEVRIIGNVGKITTNEKSTYIAVACNESYTKKEAPDEWIENTVWVDVIFFGPVCARIEKAGIKTGDTVLVVGKLNQREYEGKKYLNVIGQKAQLIQRPQRQKTELPVEDNGDSSEPTVPSDDLPF